MDMNIAEAAQKYMDLNFKVVFLQPGSKAPERRWWGPVSKGSIPEFTSETIKNAQRDGCNIGLYMVPLFSNEDEENYKCLFALDFDDPELYDEWKKANPELAKSPTQRTPAGGYHVLFSASEPYNSAKSKRLDFIGYCWHIAVWPSVVPPGASGYASYQWLTPPWEAPIVHITGDDLREALGISEEVWQTLDWEADDYDDRDHEEDYYKGWSR